MARVLDVLVWLLRPFNLAGYEHRRLPLGHGIAKVAQVALRAAAAAIGLASVAALTVTAGWIVFLRTGNPVNLMSSAPLLVVALPFLIAPILALRGATIAYQDPLRGGVILLLAAVIFLLIDIPFDAPFASQRVPQIARTFSFWAIPWLVSGAMALVARAIWPGKSEEANDSPFVQEGSGGPWGTGAARPPRSIELTEGLVWLLRVGAAGLGMVCAMPIIVLGAISLLGAPFHGGLLIQALFTLLPASLAISAAPLAFNNALKAGAMLLAAGTVFLLIPGESRQILSFGFVWLGIGWLCGALMAFVSVWVAPRAPSAQPF